MRLRTQSALAGGFGALMGMTGCASPGDVQESYNSARGTYETAKRTYDSDMAFANEWNDHVLGIPAAGWLAITVVVSVLGLVLLMWLTWLVARAIDRRRDDRRELALERERTVRQATERGPCPGCGLDVIGVLNQIREKT